MLGDPQKRVELLGSYQGHDESSCLEATRTSKSPDAWRSTEGEWNARKPAGMDKVLMLRTSGSQRDWIEP